MLIEREGPLRQLRNASQRASGGQGSVVVLGGEAGIGKTSLLQEFAHQPQTELRVFWGGCEALFTPRPLGPLHDMAKAIDPVLAQMLEQGASQDRLFPAVLHALQSLRETGILIFEDMHWADHATLDLIKYLGRRAPLLRAVLLLSLRTDEVGRDHPLAQVLGDLPSQSTIRIDLNRLSPEGVAGLAGKAGVASDHLYQITEGNPFFVTELLAAKDTSPAQIPASVRDAVWSRILRMTPDERKLLEVISAVPGSVEPWLIEALLGRGADSLVDTCVARGMLLRDELGNLKFRHELTRLATHEQLSRAVRKALHARIEAALSDGAPSRPGVTLSSRVHHAAAADDGARVLTLAPQAAAQAARLGAHLQAVSHLATALRYVEQAPKEQAAQLYEDWAYESGLAVGITEEIIIARNRAVTLWRELKRTDKAGLNLRWLSRLHWYRGEAKLAKDYIDQALRELEASPPGPDLANACSARSQMFFLHDQTDEAISWGLRAIALAEQFGAMETRIHALNTVGSARLFSGRDGGRECIEESLALALEHGFHEQAARAYTNYAEYAVVFKETALAERLLAEGIAFDTKHDLDAWTHYLVGRQAQLRMEQGRLREAETICQGVMKLARLTLVMQLPALTVLAKVRTRLGEADGAELLGTALSNAEATAERQNIMPVRFGLVEAAWLVQDFDACAVHLAALAAAGPDSFDPWELGEFAVWWRRCQMAAPFPAAGTPMAAPRAAELIGDMAGAARQWSLLGLPYEEALSLMQIDGPDAGSALARAVTLLEAMEAKPAAQLARDRAKSLGLADQLPKHRRGHYSHARAHPLGLTKRELQILALITQGFGNKDIAREFGRSQRTIEHHVSAVLGKLHASNRIDVLLRLQSEPWLLPAAETGPPNKK